MIPYNLVYSYLGDDLKGFENEYAFALSSILSHHSFISGLGEYRNKTQLITDEAGKIRMIDKFGLHFDEVIVVDKTTNAAEQRKLFDSALVYVEQDTYLLKTFPIRVFNSYLFCDYIMRNNPIDVEVVKKLIPNLDYRDDLIDRVYECRDNLWSIETGIVGQNVYGYWREYYDYASYVVQENPNWINRDLKRFMENVLPFYYFKQRNITFDVIIDRNKETEFEMFHHQVSNLNYIRLYGESKRNPFLINAIEKLVRNNYPESYDKIGKLK
jgi:hypothetical protein